MEGQIVVIITGIRSSPKIVAGPINATGLRDVLCARLTRRMSFGGVVKRLRIDEVSRYCLQWGKQQDEGGSYE